MQVSSRCESTVVLAKSNNMKTKKQSCNDFDFIIVLSIDLLYLCKFKQ